MKRFLKERKSETFHIITFGCKVNQYNSEILKEAFEEFGYKWSDWKKAEIVVLNTCVVTHKAERDIRKWISKIGKENPSAEIILTGCGAILERNWEVNKVLKIDEIIDLNKSPKNAFKGHSRIYVKIQEGCNLFCSYCIVPYVKGPPRDKPKEIILKEIDYFLQQGYKEIVLIGTQIGLWGKGKLVDLIREILEIKKDFRLRLSSISPLFIKNNEMFFKLFKNEKLCPHIHLSIQSGSNKVLKEMRRFYTKEDIFFIVDKLREYRPEINIGADFIVGFPTETEDDFNETVDTVKKIEPGYMHVFEYSPRDFTPAGKMKQLPSKVKKERVKIMLDLNLCFRKKYASMFIGKALNLIVENDKFGTTENYLKVKIFNNSPVKYKKAEIYPVKIVGFYQEPFILKGEGISDGKQEVC